MHGHQCFGDDWIQRRGLRDLLGEIQVQLFAVMLADIIFGEHSDHVIIVHSVYLILSG